MKSPIEEIAAFDKFGSVLGLERIKELLRRLGDPQKKLKIIHVGGTNGKGSVSRFLYQMFQEAGYKTGIYSSPYLEIFNERIEINGEYISDEDLSIYAKRVSQIAKEMCSEGLLSPTEFDVVTAIGFLYFLANDVEFVILEVGLGGVGDSTNVIDEPVATVFTSISMDHMDRLGETIEKIAMEKAGIVKKSTPAISGIGDTKAKSIVEKKCKELDAPFIDGTRGIVNIREENIFGSIFDVNIKGVNYEKVEISMAGKHQIENCLVAMWTVAVLSERGIIDITLESIFKGLKKAKNKGRFEVVRTNPYYIIDGAHNQAGMESFVKTVKEDLEDKKLLIVMGILADKENGLMESLKMLNSEFIATEPDNPRKLTKEKMAKLLEENNKDVIAVLTPEQSIKYIDNIKDEYDAILFVGSLYMIGEIRRLLHVG